MVYSACMYSARLPPYGGSWNCKQGRQAECARSCRSASAGALAGVTALSAKCTCLLGRFMGPAMWRDPCHETAERRVVHPPEKQQLWQCRRRHRGAAAAAAQGLTGLGPLLWVRHNSGPPLVFCIPFTAPPCAQTSLMAVRRNPNKARTARKICPEPPLTREPPYCRSGRQSEGQPGCPPLLRSAAQPGLRSPGPSACGTARTRAVCRI